MHLRYLAILLLISCRSAPEFASPLTHLRKSFAVENKNEARALIQSRMNYVSEKITQHGTEFCQKQVRHGYIWEEKNGLLGMTTVFLDEKGDEFCPDETHKPGWILHYFCHNEKEVHELKFLFPRPKMKARLPCP